MEKTILLVEDEALIRDALSKLLSQVGYSVIAVETAEEGIDQLKKKSTQLIISDLNLPGMNGLEFCRKAKEANPIACLFAITGHQSLFELSDCREAGFDDYFTKPVEMSALLEAARQAFERVERWKTI